MKTEAEILLNETVNTEDLEDAKSDLRRISDDVVLSMKSFERLGFSSIVAELEAIDKKLTVIDKNIEKTSNSAWINPYNWISSTDSFIETNTCFDKSVRADFPSTS